jgi:hypothetical protein
VVAVKDILDDLEVLKAETGAFAAESQTICRQRDALRAAFLDHLTQHSGLSEATANRIIDAVLRDANPGES